MITHSRTILLLSALMFLSIASLVVGVDYAAAKGGGSTPPTGSSQISKTTGNPSAVVTNTVTLSGQSGPPTGTVTFFLCGPTASATPCATGGTQVGGSIALTTVSGHGNNGPGTSEGVSGQSNPLNTSGTYCFRVEYSGDGQNGNYSPGSYTSTTNECISISNSVTAVTLSSFEANSGTEPIANPFVPLLVGVAFSGLTLIGRRYLV